MDKVHLELAGADDASMLGKTETQVKDELVAELKAAGFQAASEVSEPKGAWKIEAALAMHDVTDPDAPAKAEVVIQLTRPDENTDRELRSRGEAKVKGPSLDERRDASRAAVEIALRDAATRAALLLSLLHKSDTELLAEKEPRAKDLALGLLAERGNAVAYEPLLEKLKSDDLETVRRALGGLLVLKDPRAVPAIIEAGHQKDDTFQREIVFALGTLGGDEAEAYLSLIAEGHDQPLMRASALQALEELKLRRDGGLIQKRGTP